MTRLTTIDSTLVDAIAAGCDTVQHKYDGVLYTYEGTQTKLFGNRLFGGGYTVLWDCIQFTGQDITKRPYKERYAFTLAWLRDARPPNSGIVRNYPITSARGLWHMGEPHTCGLVFRNSMEPFGAPVRVARKYNERPGELV